MFGWMVNRRPPHSTGLPRQRQPPLIPVAGVFPPSFFTLFLGACLAMAGDNGVFYQRMNVMFMDQKEILRGLLGNCFRFNFALTSQKGDHFFVDCLVTVSDSIFT
jgi:hypothetical protein